MSGWRSRELIGTMEGFIEFDDINEGNIGNLTQIVNLFIGAIEGPESLLSIANEALYENRKEGEDPTYASQEEIDNITDEMYKLQDRVEAYKKENRNG